VKAYESPIMKNAFMTNFFFKLKVELILLKYWQIRKMNIFNLVWVIN